MDSAEQFEKELDQITEQLDRKARTYILSAMNDEKTPPEAYVSGTADQFDAIYLIASAAKALFMDPKINENENKTKLAQILLLSILKVLYDELGEEGMLKMYNETKEDELLKEH